MKNALAEMVRAGGMEVFTIKYYSPEVEASWTFDDDQASDPSLQIVYKRDIMINDEKVEENFWLYLSPEDAIAVGNLLLAWGEARLGK
jgi:hypothetical protein